MHVYTSLAAAARSLLQDHHGIVLRELDLTRSDDLKCKNIMCEKLDQACVCKLARYLVQNRFPEMNTIRLAYNGIDTVPLPVYEIKTLKELDLRGNKLKNISDDVVKLESLEILDLRNNELEWISPKLWNLPRLQKVLVEGNPKLDLSNLGHQANF